MTSIWFPKVGFLSQNVGFSTSLKSRKICDVFYRTWILNRTRLFSCKNSWTFFRDFKSRYFYILFVSSRISNKKMQIFCQKLPKFFKTTIFFFKNEPFYQWRWFGWRKIFRSCIIWCDQNSCQRFRESDNIRWFWNFQTNHSWRGNFFIFSKFQKMNFGEHFFDMFSVWKWAFKIFKSSGFYNDQKVSIEWVSTRVYGF